LPTFDVVFQGADSIPIYERFVPTYCYFVIVLISAYALSSDWFGLALCLIALFSNSRSAVSYRVMLTWLSYFYWVWVSYCRTGVSLIKELCGQVFGLDKFSVNRSLTEDLEGVCILTHGKQDLVTSVINLLSVCDEVGWVLVGVVLPSLLLVGSLSSAMSFMAAQPRARVVLTVAAAAMCFLWVLVLGPAVVAYYRGGELGVFDCLVAVIGQSNFGLCVLFCLASVCLTIIVVTHKTLCAFFSYIALLAEPVEKLVLRTLTPTSLFSIGMG
jgi:hypothetical protein